MSLSPKKLTTAQIAKLLTKVPDWNLNVRQTELSRIFSFKEFITGLSFVAKVTVHAEIKQHHPVIELSYGKVKVSFTTHDIKGLSKLDFELAQSIDSSIAITRP